MSFPVDVVVMAAGKGTRMKSQLPKVLHRLGGRALAQHVIDTAARLSARSVVVITGHGAERVEAGLHAPAGGTQLKYVRQAPQLGTGHAVQQAAPVLPDDGVTLVLSGDVPLTRPEIDEQTIRGVADATPEEVRRDPDVVPHPLEGPAGRDGEAVEGLAHRERRAVVVRPPRRRGRGGARRRAGGDGRGAAEGRWAVRFLGPA